MHVPFGWNFCALWRTQRQVSWHIDNVLHSALGTFRWDGDFITIEELPWKERNEEVITAIIEYTINSWDCGMANYEYVAIIWAQVYIIVTFRELAGLIIIRGYVESWCQRAFLMSQPTKVITLSGKVDKISWRRFKSSLSNICFLNIYTSLCSA